MIYISIRLGGEMAEWFKARAWKARVPKKYRGFESPSLRQISKPFLRRYLHRFRG